MPTFVMTVSNIQNHATNAAGLFVGTAVTVMSLGATIAAGDTVMTAAKATKQHFAVNAFLNEEFAFSRGLAFGC